jgi:subtilisin family serine protease
MEGRMKSIPELRAAESASRNRTAPARVQDTVIVKLKAGPTAVRRFAAAAGLGRRGAGEVRQPFVAGLVEAGYAAEVIPIFPAPLPFAADRRPARALAAAVAEAGRPLKRARGLVAVKVDRGTSAEALAAHLDSLKDEVEYAYVPPVKYLFPARRRSRPARRRRARKPNDPLGSRQWGHGAVRIHAARSRRGFRDAADVVVAVVDSGIDRDHPDLDGAIHSYVNFLSDSEDDRDYVGHGTHVAGIIAAETNNRIGIAGLCAARIMALKGLPRRGNRWNAEKYYQALGHPIDQGARVLNLSLGGGFDRGERDIIADLIDAGITVVAAMGNEFEEGNPVSYPAAYDGVIAVGASDEVDRRASFSCTGRHIALVAPGVNILSTVPRYPSEFAASLEYDAWPGTSMATPHVAAAVALLLAKSPRLTPAAIRKRLVDTADAVPSQDGPDEEHGAGRLDIAAALR